MVVRMGRRRVSGAFCCAHPRGDASNLSTTISLKETSVANDRSGKNKNQTAAERALLQEALSGKVCSKCGKEVKIKDLIHVKSLSFGTRSKALMPYHRACYAV